MRDATLMRGPPGLARPTNIIANKGIVVIVGRIRMVLSVPSCGSSHKVVYSFQFWTQRVLLRSKIGDQFIDAVIALTSSQARPALVCNQMSSHAAGIPRP
jgi:hypothetical protein